MGKDTGFLEFGRQATPYRPVEDRLRDWQVVLGGFDDATASEQGARCMDCGIPFCNEAKSSQPIPQV